MASARQTTTGANGTYSFTGVPYGLAYQLVAHDPAAAFPDQALQGIALIPNDTKVIDLNLQVPVTPVGPKLADLALPVGPARHVASDPTTGRVFVSAADEVITFDHDGNQLTRFQSQWGADGLTISGSKLYVNQSTVGSVSTIDIPTLTLGGSFTVGLTDGQLAVAANKLVYTTGNDQWVTLTTQDLTTHVVTTVSGGNFYVPNLSAVAGSANLVITDGGSFSYVVDAATATVVTGGVYTDFQIGIATARAHVVGQRHRAQPHEPDRHRCAVPGGRIRNACVRSGERRRADPRSQRRARRHPQGEPPAP